MSKPDKQHKERPILFSAPMVRAILDGRKTQTRRVIKGSIEHRSPYIPAYLEAYKNSPAWGELCPYGKRGYRLWVREKFTLTNHGDPVYFADFKDKRGDYWHSIAVDPKDVKWKSPIFMPRAASRITLEITEIRVERLQDISEADAVAEGVFCEHAGASENFTHASEYKDLWESINGAGSWDANPWVWVIEFKRVTP